MGPCKRKNEGGTDKNDRAKKRVRRKCVCGYPGCPWSGTEQSIYKHTKQKHNGCEPLKVFPESQFAPGGRFASWILQKGKFQASCAYEWFK